MLTWVLGMQVANRFGVGCIACCKSGGTGAFAKFRVWSTTAFQLTNLRKHHGSPGHCQSVAKWFGLALPEENNRRAPPLDEFKAVWLVFKKERCSDKTVAAGFRKKVCKKLHCLAEAVRILDRTDGLVTCIVQSCWKTSVCLVSSTNCKFKTDMKLRPRRSCILFVVVSGFLVRTDNKQ